MKGAAGMVGMMRVSRLAHRLEDLLVELRAGTRRSTPELTDAMLLVVDGLGRLIASAASGEQDASDEAALERLLPAPLSATAAEPLKCSLPRPLPEIAPEAAAAAAIDRQSRRSSTADVPRLPPAAPPARCPKPFRHRIWTVQHQVVGDARGPGGTDRRAQPAGRRGVRRTAPGRTHIRLRDAQGP